ncbi:MAG TPA: ATP-binding protein [Thermoanaerobaculia bacterium]
MISRTFAADHSAPRAATAWLRSQALGLSEARFSDAELCVDELVTNVVRYAWPEGETHAVTLSLARSASEVEITLEDDGRPFDPNDAPGPPAPRSLEEAVPGGRGLMLVRAIAPRLRYERRDGRNRTTIAFPVES